LHHHRFVDGGSLERRAVPEGLDGGWSATADDLDGLDSLLARRVEAELAAATPVGSPQDRATTGHATTYHAQAGAFMRGAERVVYLNGFAANVIHDFGDSTKWRRRPIVACDGGQGFFGALFIPAHRTLTSFLFNSPG
jgi:hypothetical protein